MPKFTLYVRMYACMYVCMYVCVFMYIHVCMYDVRHAIQISCTGYVAINRLYLYLYIYLYLISISLLSEPINSRIAIGL